MNFRVLPLTIALSTGLLAVKLVDIAQGSNQLSKALLVSDAVAQDPAPEGAKEAKPEEKKDEKPAEEKKEAEAKPEEKEGEKTAEGEKKEQAEGEKPAKKEKHENPNVSTEAPDTVKSTTATFSQTEVDLLQSLSKRREELEVYSKELEMKENLLNATEMRIDQKLTTMQDLKKNVDTLLAQYNEVEDTKIRSLVKIYENMKPKDAARIFDELEMPVLLMVIDKMSERKVAPVLANMDPKKAMQVTTELAEQRRLNNVPAQTPPI